MAKLDFSKKASFNKPAAKKETVKIDTSLPNNSVVKIPVSLIDAGDNIRNEKNDMELEELADSIKEYGLVEPIVVYEENGRYVAKCGSRRLKACKVYDIPEIDCIIAPKFANEKERIIFQAIENEHRINMNPKERETYIKKMLDMGMTQTEIAKALHKPKGWISESLKALTTREENNDIFNKISGDISTRTAYTFGNLDEEEKNSVLANTSINGNTSEALKKAIEEEKKKRNNKSDEEKKFTHEEIDTEFGISFDDSETEEVQDYENEDTEVKEAPAEKIKNFGININYSLNENSKVFKLNTDKKELKGDVESFLLRQLENFYIEKGYNIE